MGLSAPGNSSTSLKSHFLRRVFIPTASVLHSSGDFWKPSPLLMDSRHSLNGSDHTLVPTQPGHSGIQETRRVHVGGHGDAERTGEWGETWDQEMRAERAATSAAQANVKASGGLPWWSSG